MVDATTEVMWIQTLLYELEITVPRAAKLWRDNIGANFLYAIQCFMLVPNM